MLNIRNILVLFVIVNLLGCNPKITNLDSRGNSIICFGDSITEGIGARAGEDYPSLLAKEVRIPVYNLGIRGETTRDALKRLDRDVLSYNPKIVIVEFGGNDFLKKIPLKETLKNIENIVGRIQRRGAIVVLVSVKIGLFYDSYTKGYRKIANKYGAVFIPNITRGIMDNPKLKADKIHPNGEGYKIIAERILKKIKPLLN